MLWCSKHRRVPTSFALLSSCRRTILPHTAFLLMFSCNPHGQCAGQRHGRRNPKRRASPRAGCCDNEPWAPSEIRLGISGGQPAPPSKREAHPRSEVQPLRAVASCRSTKPAARHAPTNAAKPAHLSGWPQVVQRAHNCALCLLSGPSPLLRSQRHLYPRNPSTRSVERKHKLGQLTLCIKAGGLYACRSVHQISNCKVD